MASNHQADLLRRHLYTERISKSGNENIYYTIDLINTAINTAKEIHFQYIEYTPEKKKLLKHNGRVYAVSPYGLWWDHDRYYLSGHCAWHKKITAFRVERIEHIKLTESKQTPAPKGFDITDFTQHRFHMYDVPPSQIQLRCENEMMRHIIDRFGEAVKTKRDGDSHFTADVETAPNPPFFAWIFQLEGKIKINSYGSF